MEAYSKDYFHSSDDFLRIVFPSAEPIYTTEQAIKQVELVKRLAIDLSERQIQILIENEC